MAFDIAWVEACHLSVDTMNGFIENYLDARGIKGAWEGLVYYVNRGEDVAHRHLADAAAWVETACPIDPRYRKPAVPRRHRDARSMSSWRRAEPVR